MLSNTLKLITELNHHVCEINGCFSPIHSVFNFYFKECPANLPLFKIRGTNNCNIKNTCTAVSCCVEVGKVGRTFEFMMDIDFCNQKFTVGIEKLVEEVSLNMFEYGKSCVFCYLILRMRVCIKIWASSHTEFYG